MWLPLIRHLESHYRCLAPDLPGLGRSAAPADFDLSHENKARFVDELLDAGYDLSIKNPAVRAMILRLYRTTDPKDFAGWEEKLLALTRRTPTLVLWGDRDPFIAKTFAERFGGQVRHFPENGHWLPVEAPEAVAQALFEFLA